MLLYKLLEHEGLTVRYKLLEQEGLSALQATGT